MDSNNQVHVTASNYIENQCQLNNRCSVNKAVGWCFLDKVFALFTSMTTCDWWIDLWFGIDIRYKAILCMTLRFAFTAWCLGLV